MQPASAPPASIGNTSQPALNDSVGTDTAGNDNARSVDDNSRDKRSKRAERKRDRQNRTARTRSAPQDEDRNGSSGGRDASGATVRTYQTEGGGRVTVYQRGPTMQVGDRVDFGDAQPRSRRRAERRYGSRDDDGPSQASETRGFGEFFFGR
jgi:hypothetical protein